MKTLSEVMTPHGVEVPAHLVADAEIPIVSGLQRQGDVLIRPTRSGHIASLTRIPPEGVAVVRGEAGGNTHLLVGDGWWSPAGSRDPMVLGTVKVEEGQAAYLLHPEHGAQGIGPGTHVVSRQREQAEQIRLVAD